MAKSSRSSRTKTNRKALRANIFGPIETARAERLNAKLMEMASQPKPDRPVAMDVDTKPSNTNKKQVSQDEDKMEVDGENPATGRAPRSKKSRTGRIQKVRRGKATSTITFPKKLSRGVRAKGRQKK